jgi:hypothetical protein
MNALAASTPAPQVKPPASPAFWRALERATCLETYLALWRQSLGDDLEVFQQAFLDRLPATSPSFFCERCHCSHQIIHWTVEEWQKVCHQWGGTFDLANLPDKVKAGVIEACCRCDIQCRPFELKLDDIAIWSFNFKRFARALCQAFDLDSTLSELQPGRLWQIGSWSCDTVPVILSFQPSPEALQQSIYYLGVTLRRPFILLTPTAQNLNARTLQGLASVHAEAFALDAHLRVSDHGTFVPVKLPGELFSKFAPKPADETAADALRTAFALIDELDKESALEPKASEVFRLHCMKGKTTRDVAFDLKCGTATINRRLKQIQERTGKHPKYFRQFSGHYERVKNQLRDPRARHIHVKSTLDQPNDGDDSFD